MRALPWCARVASSWHALSMPVSSASAHAHGPRVALLCAHASLTLPRSTDASMRRSCAAVCYACATPRQQPPIDGIATARRPPVPETSASFGDLLRQVRSASSLSQEELAQRSGLSVRGISDLERGARSAPRLETVRLLADALGVDQESRTALLAAARPGTAR